jgi:hypothetical protein
MILTSTIGGIVILIGACALLLGMLSDLTQVIPCSFRESFMGKMFIIGVITMTIGFFLLIPGMVTHGL